MVIFHNTCHPLEMCYIAMEAIAHLFRWFNVLFNRDEFRCSWDRDIPTEGSNRRQCSHYPHIVFTSQWNTLGFMILKLATLKKNDCSEARLIRYAHRSTKTFWTNSMSVKNHPFSKANSSIVHTIYHLVI